MHCLTQPSAAPFRRDLLGLAIEDGVLRLYGFDARGSRAHFCSLPARTEGAASVVLARADVLARHWGRPGRLLVFDDHVRFEPDGGSVVWAPATPAWVPTPDDRPAVGGVLGHKLDLRAAILDAVGGDRRRHTLPDELRLTLDRHRRLVIEAPGRGMVRLPLRYAQGDFEVRIAPAWLLDAVNCAPADEIIVESLGHEAPLRIESGWFTAIVATRCADPYL